MANSVVKKVDTLGRLPLPMEVRERVGIYLDTEVKISVDGDRLILERAN